MIVRNANGTWVDHDNTANHGTITVIKSQAEYDNMEHKTKIGIVCAPDDVESTEIGIPYVEMEPTDEEFYDKGQTVYQRSMLQGRSGDANPLGWGCAIRFCRRRLKRAVRLSGGQQTRR